VRNKPTGTDLIILARKVLVERLTAALPEDLRHDARLVARAMNIASREIEAGEWPLKRALERLSEIMGKEVDSEIEFAESSPGALERVVGELNRQLSERIRAGEFDSDSSTKDQVRDHLLQTSLDKLREDDPRYLESQGFA